MICLLIFVSLGCGLSQKKTPTVPKDIASYLDTAYKGWKLSTVREQLTKDFFASSKFAPNLAWGDFDHDGSRDYAVEISYGDSVRKRIVIAFLNRGSKFIPSILETHPDDEEIFISVTKKGTKGYNWEQEKPFVYPSDAIDVIYAGKAGNSYFFRNGKFNKIQTGD